MAFILCCDPEWQTLIHPYNRWHVKICLSVQKFLGAHTSSDFVEPPPAKKTPQSLTKLLEMGSRDERVCLVGAAIDKGTAGLWSPSTFAILDISAHSRKSPFGVLLCVPFLCPPALWMQQIYVPLPPFFPTSFALNLVGLRSSLKKMSQGIIAKTTEKITFSIFCAFLPWCEDGLSNNHKVSSNTLLPTSELMHISPILYFGVILTRTL